MKLAADGGCERDVVHRINEGYRAWGALKNVLILFAAGCKKNGGPAMGRAIGE